MIESIEVLVSTWSHILVAYWTGIHIYNTGASDLASTLIFYYTQSVFVYHIDILLE